MLEHRSKKLSLNLMSKRMALIVYRGFLIWHESAIFWLSARKKGYAVFSCLWTVKSHFNESFMKKTNGTISEQTRIRESVS